MWSEGVGAAGGLIAGGAGPGVAVCSPQGVPRTVSARLLSLLGLSALPSQVQGLAQLLEAAGLHRSEGSLWVSAARAVYAGEELLEDGSRLLWVLPAAPEEAGRLARVRYLSLASHDLRGALANIRSYAGLLLGPRYAHEPRVQRGLETIRRNADRALGFAQNFFDASRAELGGLSFEREVQPLAPLLAEALKPLQEEASAAGVELSLAPVPELPDLPLDGGRVQHAVEAFIAHHLTRAQAGERIEVRCARDVTGVRVEVRRHGVPLEAAFAARLFEREARAFEEKKLEDPLRLSLARHEVALHGGEVGAWSDAGGTTLFLTLPFQDQ
ncbi:HAMP domain-containing histidine kinase [Aggregicoccus sp. 17bor-14]|uniref:sensor histidine kinase n=1 Tax=Myxococcaceae TaxID=31 RepID=UPI0012F14572|nr:MULTISPECIES: HAMP domain-containing sensor histidine kinase [Myxococcaceae]MBF5041271.1 HAMP domain-containing histidine kinase [Simulacricoccus sp. 17bor-14]MRI87057.1 HAMP domain-containing histidine kinase [Aggregicoccus sp. 17bor-14]